MQPSRSLHAPFLPSRLANGSAEFVDAREVAPAAANETMFKGAGPGAGRAYRADSGSGRLPAAAPCQSATGLRGAFSTPPGGSGY